MGRAIVIVLDSLGIGEMPDSHLYGDEGSNTLKNTALAVGGLALPNMQQLGLGNIEDIEGVAPTKMAWGAYGKMAEQSAGKDSTMGHWEMMGLVTKKPFPTYPNGFPAEIIREFEEEIGRKTLGNVVASGTVIIQELGDEHIATGYPIVYTSADSVFQIAAHEDIIPVAELYRMCRIARNILTGANGVGRVIARPFVGSKGKYSRTANRHDFSLEPEKTLLDYIIESGQKVTGIGKIKDLFAGKGISESFPTENNNEGIEMIINTIKKPAANGLIFANLLDFDQIYGHRNDYKGYANALKEFDAILPEIMAAMQDDDILFLTADHGCDPTTPSTDHSREYVPILAFGKSIRKGIDLGTRSSFADLAQTIAEYLGIKSADLDGKSFYKQLVRADN